MMERGMVKWELVLEWSVHYCIDLVYLNLIMLEGEGY